MPYVMDSDHDDTYMSVSGLSGFNYYAEVATLQRKLKEKGKSVSVDGKYGPGTDGVLKQGYEAVPSIGKVVYAAFPADKRHVYWAIQTLGLINEGPQILKAFREYAQGGVATPTSTPPPKAGGGGGAEPPPVLPDQWEQMMTGAGGPVVQEEGGFFEKYWWAIAIAAVGIGGVVIWRMRRKPEAAAV